MPDYVAGELCSLPVGLSAAAHRLAACLHLDTILADSLNVFLDEEHQSRPSSTTFDSSSSRSEQSNQLIAPRRSRRAEELEVSVEMTLLLRLAELEARSEFANQFH